MDESKKNSLINSRSYAGTETFSDHRLVVTRLEVSWHRLYRNVNKSTITRYNTRKLQDSTIREEYQRKLSEKVQSADQTSYKWTELQQDIIKTVEEVLGCSENTSKHHIQNAEIEDLSKRQKEIRMQISNSSNVETAAELRGQRKSFQKDITRIVKREREKRLEGIIDRVEYSPNDSKMFKAVQ